MRLLIYFPSPLFSSRPQIYPNAKEGSLETPVQNHFDMANRCHRSRRNPIFKIAKQLTQLPRQIPERIQPPDSAVMQFNNVICTETPHVLVNTFGNRLHTVHYRPQWTDFQNSTIVFVHGNGGSGSIGLFLLPFAIPAGISVLTFDFAGSGKSTGKRSTFGAREQFDIRTVVSFLETLGVQNIVIWGYSMGATSSILYAGNCACSPSVRGLVLTAPYSSFQKVVTDTVASAMIKPLSVIFRPIGWLAAFVLRQEFRRNHGFDIYDIDALAAARTVRNDLPVLFVHGDHDEVVPLEDSQKMLKVYPCPDKELIVVRYGTHLPDLPWSAMERALAFIIRVTQHSISVHRESITAPDLPKRNCQ